MFEAPQAHGSRRSNFVREQFRGRLRACLQLERVHGVSYFPCFSEGGYDPVANPFSKFNWWKL